MKKYNDYLEAKKSADKAESYYLLLSKTDSQSGKPYQVHKASVCVTISGQAYAGANNYHESSKEINEALEKIIISRAPELLREAVKYLRDKEFSAKIECRHELTKLLKEIDTATSGHQPGDDGK